MEITVSKLIGQGYGDVWFTNDSSRYRVEEGARNTKKSYNMIGIEPVIKILSDPRRNVMMVRQIYKDNADSTYTMLKSTIHRLGLDGFFKFSASPYKITRKDTGQVILFRGMNDPDSITSTVPEFGYLTDIYFEEAFQLKSYEEFRVVDGSLRGDLPEGLFLQITFCMNAWDSGHWINSVFFEEVGFKHDLDRLYDKGFQYQNYPDFNLGFGAGLSIHVTSYKVNEFRAPDYDASMEVLRSKAHDIWLVEGMGLWGNTQDKTYSSWSEELVVPEHQVLGKRFDAIMVGIDTGMSDGEGKIKYSEDNAKRLGSAMVMEIIGVQDNWTTVVALDEYFDSNLGKSSAERKSEPQYVNEMADKLAEWQAKYSCYGTLNVFVDSADPGFRDELRMVLDSKRVINIRLMPSTKIKILSRVRFTNMLMAFGEMRATPLAANLCREIRNARKSKEGKPREDFDDHAINAWEYAWAPIRERVKRWRTSFKEE